jgi:2-oxoglutarate/2-oxoacid ferredoxin oxidoreductase subunit alpha
MNQDKFCLTIGGMAGQGIKAAGLTFAKIAMRSGKHVFTYTGFPSLIKGGHNFTQISISKTGVSSPSNKNDFWIALDQRTLDLHLSEFTDGCGILFDQGKNYDLSKINTSAILYPIPLSQFAKEAGGSELLSNTVALGAVLALLQGDINMLKTMLSEAFEHKGEEMVRINHEAAQKGYNYAQQNFPDKQKAILVKEENIEKRMIANGTDTAAMAAIASGLKFAAIYPMSPISNILAVLAANQDKYGYIYKQPEDEISAINMAIGASFAGVRSMTATSGGGFSLMTEAYGLAGMSETPLVIIEGMRPGPASGLPTWSGQGDLMFTLHASQGDFPRIILAAGDAIEVFEQTMLAFNLADKYQTPVMVLIDKNICEDDQSMPIPDISGYNLDRGKITFDKKADFQRYKLEEDGVSERSIPGVGNFFIGNSYEHNQIGYDSEEPGDIISQMEKRMKKLETCRESDMQPPTLYGPENADITIVSWGSNKGSILEALQVYPGANYLHITWVSPFPEKAVKEVLGKAGKILNIECNYTAAMGSLIKEKTGIEIKDNLLKYDGRPIFPEEIIKKLEEMNL